MPKNTDISDSMLLLGLEVNAARVFVETVGHKLDFMSKLFDEAELQLCKAEARCAELKKLGAVLD